MIHTNGFVPYSRKYLWSLNLAVWPQTDHEKILAEFKFDGSVSGPFIKERCRLSLEVLEQSVQIYKNKTSSVLAPI